MTAGSRCKAGAALAVLNRALRQRGRWYGPDPVTRSITTMGSVLATNASGSHYLRSGSARDTIDSMRIVTVEGELVELSRHHKRRGGTAGRLARGIAEIRSQFESLIDGQVQCSQVTRRLSTWTMSWTTSGFVDMAKFMVGTQGTLGIVIDATVRTEMIPAHRGVVLLFFHRLDSAARCGVAALRHGLVACDLMDRRLLQIARDTSDRVCRRLAARSRGDAVGRDPGRIAW